MRKKDERLKLEHKTDDLCVDFYEFLELCSYSSCRVMANNVGAAEKKGVTCPESKCFSKTLLPISLYLDGRWGWF